MIANPSGPRRHINLPRSAGKPAAQNGPRTLPSSFRSLSYTQLTTARRSEAAAPTPPPVEPSDAGPVVRSTTKATIARDLRFAAQEEQNYLFGFYRFAVKNPVPGALVAAAAVAVSITAGYQIGGVGQAISNALQHPNLFARAALKILFVAGVVLPAVELTRGALFQAVTWATSRFDKERTLREIRTEAMENLQPTFVQGIFSAFRNHPVLSTTLGWLSISLQIDFWVYSIWTRSSGIGEKLGNLLMGEATNGVGMTAYAVWALGTWALLRAGNEGFREWRAQGRPFGAADLFGVRLASVPYLCTGGNPTSWRVLWYSIARSSELILGTTLKVGFIYFLATSFVDFTPVHGWIVEKVADTGWGPVAWFFTFLAGLGVSQGLGYMQTLLHKVFHPNSKTKIVHGKTRGDYFKYDYLNLWQRFRQFGEKAPVMCGGGMAVVGSYAAESILKQFVHMPWSLYATWTDKWASICKWVPEQGVPGTAEFVAAHGNKSGVLTILTSLVVTLAVASLYGVYRRYKTGAEAKANYPFNIPEDGAA